MNPELIDHRTKRLLPSNKHALSIFASHRTNCLVELILPKININNRELILSRKNLYWELILPRTN